MRAGSRRSLDVDEADQDAHRSDDRERDRQARSEADQHMPMPSAHEAPNTIAPEVRDAGDGSDRSTAPMSAPPPQTEKRRPNAAEPPAKRSSASHASPTLTGPVNARVEGGDDDQRAADRRIGPGGADAAADAGEHARPLLVGRGRSDARPGRGRWRWPPRRRSSHRSRRPGAVPTMAMSAPASAGPMRPMIWLEPWITAFAGASMPPGDEHRDDRAQGRVEERVDDAEDRREHVEVPQLGAAGEDERREEAHDDAAHDVRDEHEGPRGEAVAERPTDEHEHGARDRRRHEHGAQRQARAGDLEGEPGERDEVELVAEDADRLSGEEEAEVADAQRLEAASGPVSARRSPARVSDGGDMTSPLRLTPR